MESSVFCFYVLNINTCLVISYMVSGFALQAINSLVCAAVVAWLSGNALVSINGTLAPWPWLHGVCWNAAVCVC